MVRTHLPGAAPKLKRRRGQRAIGLTLVAAAGEPGCVCGSNRQPLSEGGACSKQQMPQLRSLNPCTCSSLHTEACHSCETRSIEVQRDEFSYSQELQCTLRGAMEDGQTPDTAGEAGTVSLPSPRKAAMSGVPFTR